MVKIMDSFSCQEEYDAYMSAQTEEAEAYYAEAEEFEQKIKDAIQFLVVEIGLNPDEYSEHYEKLTYKQDESEDIDL